MLLFLSIIGIFLSLILLFFNARKYSSSLFLGIFFLLVSVYSLILYALLYSKSVMLISIFPTHLTFLSYLIGPVFYWYIRSVLTDDSRLKKRDLWHLLPMTIFLTTAFPHIFTSFSYKTEIAKEIVKDVAFLQDYKFTVLSDLFSVRAVFLSRPLLVLAYALWAAGLFFNYLKRRKESSVFSRQHFMIKWLFILLGFLLLMVVSHLLLMFKPISEFISVNALQVLSAAGLMGLLISPFFFPEILYGLPRIPAIHSGLKSHGAETDHQHEGIKTHTPNFESNYLLAIGHKADSCMKEHMPYLHPEFNLAQFSVMINIPMHHLAYYFREEKKQSFIEYRNEWRISHAKMLIMDGKAMGLTLEAIGLLSGFSSRSTFFNAFKKVEEISPSTFATRLKN